MSITIILSLTNLLLILKTIERLTSIAGFIYRERKIKYIICIFNLHNCNFLLKDKVTLK